MKIISVSRRTGIPAFYSEWFMNRIRDGYVRWINPFSRLVHSISLLPHLDELDARGYRMLFHFTINGLPKAFEPRVPDAADMVECAHALSDRYGADAVLWHYDPVLVSTITDRRYHLNRFRELCAALEGAVRRCYFSFTVFHNKAQRNAAALYRDTGRSPRSVDH